MKKKPKMYYNIQHYAVNITNIALFTGRQKVMNYYKDEWQQFTNYIYAILCILSIFE